MKALTICQPFAHLITLPQSDPRHKRVENRDYWPFHYRGPLLIHAGKSHDWLMFDGGNLKECDYGIHLSEMAFGAIVAIADLISVLHISQIQSTTGPIIDMEFGGDRHFNLTWVRDHQHTYGKHCLILANVRRFLLPLPQRGAQGLFNIPDSFALSEAIRTAVPA